MFWRYQVCCILYLVLLDLIDCDWLLHPLSVAIGRFSLSLAGLRNAPEMYTASVGLYLTWIAIKLFITLHLYASQGAISFLLKLVSWMLLIMKCIFVGVILFVIIPLMMGHLIELILLSPIRVPSNKFPVFYHSTVSIINKDSMIYNATQWFLQEWALGLLHTKCICGLVWLTDINFKHTLDTVYQAGIRNIDVTFILLKVAWPVISLLSLCMTLPYIVFVGIFHLLGKLNRAIKL